MNKILSIDPGSETFGVVTIVNNLITSCRNLTTLDNWAIVDHLVTEASDGQTSVVIEDIAPYSLKLGLSTINTIKYIGQLEYALKKAGIAYALIPRWKVKEWVFNRYNEIVVPHIEKKIAKAGLISKKTGEPRKPSFQFVDDRLVIKAMKEHWCIETPKPGKSNRFGINKHAWQALGLATTYLSPHKKHEQMEKGD